MKEIETLLLVKEDSWTRIRQTRGWDELVSEMGYRAARLIQRVLVGLVMGGWRGCALNQDGLLRVQL